MAEEIKEKKEEKKVAESQAKENATSQPEASVAQELGISNAEVFYEKNKNVVNVVAILIALVIGGGFFWYSQMQEQEKEAQSLIYVAQYNFEADSLNLALKGDGNAYGFEQIIEEFGGTKAANIAQFYAGVCNIKLGNFDDAIDNLSAFSSSDFLLQARAYSLIGDAYLEKEDFTSAVEYFQKAVDYKPNAQFTPDYLMKLGLANELVGDNQSAYEAYDALIKNYASSTHATEAKKFRAKAQVAATK